MGFTAVLVDRARRVVDSPSGPKVDGETYFETTQGPWFKARLYVPSIPSTASSARVAARQTDDGGSRTRAVERPTLTFGVRDLSGGSLTDGNGRCVVTSQDRVEVASPQLGTYVYEVIEDPAPIRKKRKILGWQVTISRVAEHPFA